MTAGQPLVRRIDHLVIRVDDPAYDRLYALLNNTLALPAPWPIVQHPGFKSGGIFAGNVDLEILRVGQTSPSGPDPAAQARLYGIVFEGQRPFDQFETSFQDLARRGIGYIPAPYVQRAEDGEPKTLWTNVFLRNMLGSNMQMKLLFGIKNVLGDGRWLRMSARSSSSGETASRFLFDKVYRYGIISQVKYNPAWRDIDNERRQSAASLAARRGGPLGVQAVQSVVLGVTNRYAALVRWDRLLQPHPRATNDSWQIGDGPAMHIVPDTQDRIRSMVWRVRSLSGAMNFLLDQELLGAIGKDELILDPAKLFGLEIRLVE